MNSDIILKGCFLSFCILWRSRIEMDRERLRAIPLFRDLTDGDLELVTARLRSERYSKGTIVFHQGDIGDKMYLVESGQVRVVAEGQPQPLAYMGPGTFVGEMALLLAQPRSATLEVVIDAHLLSLRKSDLDDLIANHPSIGLRLSQELSQRLAVTSHQLSGTRPQGRRLAAVWGPNAARLSIVLSRQVKRTIGFLSLSEDPASSEASISSGVMPLDGAELDESSLAESLGQQLDVFNRVLVALPAEDTPLARKALQLAEVVVSLDSPPDWVSQAVDPELLWVAKDTDRDLERLARRLAGLVVGLALSSGGSKGIAHIGVLKVLRQAGIPIDMIAGTSAGALFGAWFAAGWSDQELIEEALQLSSHNYWRNWDVNLPPRAGLIKGQRAYELLNRWMDGRHFSDLETPLCIVAADILTGEEVVFDSGPVADAIRASLSLPIVADPWHYRERYLVDGAVVNPLPASVLRKRGADIVIASNVSHMADYGPLSAINRMPSFLEIISNIISASEMELIKSQLELTDVLIRPKTKARHALDFSRTAAAIAEGEEAAQSQIETIQAVLKARRET
jgi:NTE family protein